MQPQLTTHRTILRGNPATRGDIATLMFDQSSPDKLNTSRVGQSHKVIITGEFRTGSAGASVNVRQLAVGGTTQLGSTLTIDSAEPLVVMQMLVGGVYLHFTASGNNLLVASLEVRTSAECGWNDLPASQFANAIGAGGPNPAQAHSQIAVTSTASTLATLGYVLNSATKTLIIQVNGGMVRMTLNGTTPTASLGLQVVSGGLVELIGTEISAAKFIIGSGTPLFEVIGYK